MARRILQGEIYWIPTVEPDGSRREVVHPHVIVQATELNDSRIDSTVACMISTNRKRLNEPGNVLLELGEGNLPKPSIVVVSQVFVVPKASLGEWVGSLSEQRVAQVLAGMGFVNRVQGLGSA